jgi:hypothetical protein
MKSVRRIVMCGGVVVAALILAAVPASAHECLNSSRTAKANEMIAAHSKGWFDIQTSQLLGIFIISCIEQPSSDCPPIPSQITAADQTAIQQGDFEELLGELFGFVTPTSQAITDVLAFTNAVASVANTCFDVPLHYLTLNNATAAGGAPAKVTTNGKGIDHFPDLYNDQLFASYLQVYTGQPGCPSV